MDDGFGLVLSHPVFQVKRADVLVSMIVMIIRMMLLDRLDGYDAGMDEELR